MTQRGVVVEATRAPDGAFVLPKMNGTLLNSGRNHYVMLIDEPTQVNGQWRCLADVDGCLCVVELTVKPRITVRAAT